MVQNRYFRTSARGERALKTFVNACKTWFWRLGSRTLRQAPPSPLEGPEFMLSDHFNTLFLRKRVCSVVLGNFLERYRGRKCVQRSKPCFTMQIPRFLGSANHARKCENDEHLNTLFLKKCVEMHFLEFWTEPA